MDKQAGNPVRGMWFEDFVIDAPMFTAGRTISESDINIFSGLTGNL